MRATWPATARALAADRGSLPEVLGDAGLLVDPDDIDAFEAALHRMIDDEKLSHADVGVADDHDYLVVKGFTKRERITGADGKSSTLAAP